MNTEISRYLVDANGNSFSSDTDLQSLSKNAKVKNTNSGVSYKKVQGTTSGVPVFDKVPFQEGQSDAVLYSPQSLTSAQKQQARTNIGASGGDVVLYSPQSLTSAQKQQARTNIGASGGDVVLYSPQSLTTAQKQQARTNIGASGGDAVLYSQQTLTSEQKEQARANIGAIDLATGRDNFVSTTSSQSFDMSTTNRILKNIGIEHVTKNSTARGYCSRLAIGNTQLLYGKSAQAWNHGSCRYCSAMFAYPFINDACVLGTPFITVGDDNAACGVVGYSSSPRAALFGIGSPDHVSYVLYGAIGQSFPLDENASKSSSITTETRNPIWIAKNDIKLTVPKAYFLVDMFMPANSDSSDYIEFDSVAPNGNSISSATVEVGETRLDHHVGYDGTHFTRGFDLDLSSNPDSRYDNVYFSGYSDKSGGKLHVDPELSTYKMRSFVVSVPTSDISSDGNILVYFKFNQSLANGARGFIRVFYIPAVPGTVVPGASGSSSSGGSSSGGSSSPSTSGTWGVKKFNTVNGEIGESTKSVGQTVSEGKIVRIYALTHWDQRGPSDWGALNYTDWYYIWKDDNYTLTNADKSQINGLPSQSDYGSTPQSLPHVTLSYNSGNI